MLLLLEQAHVWAQEHCVGGEVLELGPISGVSQARVVLFFFFLIPLGQVSSASQRAVLWQDLGRAGLEHLGAGVPATCGI